MGVGVQGRRAAASIAQQRVLQEEWVGVVGEVEVEVEEAVVVKVGVMMGRGGEVVVVL